MPWGTHMSSGDDDELKEARGCQKRRLCQQCQELSTCEYKVKKGVPPEPHATNLIDSGGRSPG